MFIHLQKNASKVYWEVVNSKEDSPNTIQILPPSIPSLLPVFSESNFQHSTDSNKDIHSNTNSLAPSAAEISGNTQLPAPSSL